MKFQSPRQVRLHHEDGFSIEMSTQRLNDASHNLPRSGPEVSCPVERAANRSPGSCRTTSVLTDRSTAFVCTTKLQLEYAVLRLLHRRKRTTQVQEVIMNIFKNAKWVVVTKLYQIGLQEDAGAFFKNARCIAGHKRAA